MPLVVRESDLSFYKTVVISLSSCVIISWFVYALFAENYLGHQFFNNLGYLFIPILRPDFIIYFFVIPLVTTFYNFIFQAQHKTKYFVKAFPIMFMMAPFFMDNFYFILNHTPLESLIEIQFIFISSPTVEQYILLTVFYLIAGIITMFFADRMLLICVAYGFAIAMYSSLLLSSILEPQVLEYALFLAAIPKVGIFLGNQYRLWYVSFERNAPAYLTVYFLLVAIVAAVFVYLRLKLGKNFWEKKLIDVSKSKLTKLVVVLEDRKT